ncbi:zinc finger, RING-type domain-containing protein [Endozoicomonas sp. 4G]|uniref:RING finger protein n=1 Tax=Endozoicomonas sp. 4G TaxID=2872754 RepID=UPI002078FA1E|nr:zinc finger, RING-type domain-containing protein [Endozoicomonas sp. 4G]
MERLLRSLFFFLPFMASVEAQVPDGLAAYHLPDQASTLTGTLVTLGVLALRQRTWQPLPYNPEKVTEPEPYNNPFLHISSDDSFIISGPEPVPDEHTFCQPIDTPENRTWQCVGMESITSVALDIQQTLCLKTHSHQSTVVHYSHEPKLSYPEYDRPDYQTFFKNQQAEMERIHKIAAEEIGTGRVKIKIAEETTDEDTARRVFIAKTNGITVREQKDIEQEAKRHREDAHVQSDGSAMEQLHLPVGSDLCLAPTGKACQEVLSKIVSCASSEPDTTRENSQETAQGAPAGQEPNHAGKDGSVATAADSTTKDPEPSAKKQKLQQTGSESECAEDDPQQLLNQYLVGFDALVTPADDFCWLHAIHLSADQDVSTLTKTLIDMISHHLPGNEQAQATEHSAFLSSWIAAQGEDNVRSVKKQLVDKEWPDFSTLLPLLSYLFKKTFVVVNLHASGLTQDQVFTYATSNHVRVTIVSEASAINTPEERVYLGLLSRDNHYVGIRPDTQDDNDSHSCPVCIEKFTKSSGIKSTSCHHYVCNKCFDRLNVLRGWDCPICRKRQKYIKPVSDGAASADSEAKVTDSDSPGIWQYFSLPSPINDILTDAEAPLRMHRKIHLPADQRPSRPKLHHCDHEDCNFSSDLTSRLERHKWMHQPAGQGTRRYYCDYEGCNFNCNVLLELKRHKQTHLSP